jgi:recombination protein RecA
LKFYASVRLDTRRKEVLPDNKGIQVKVKVVKNKVAAPFQVCSWYAYEGKQLGQGRDKTVEYLKQNPLGLEIQKQVRAALLNFGKDASGVVNKPEVTADIADSLAPSQEESYLE